ncbi:thioesterase II family protein [Streptomyces odontomachi]|uniref:thioesterase II family protein n=1 Tax=Streptomyces odontomachi TaxID=2944940 RepID=UPI00210E2496|nr:alpha/beta fold hydrolase [Streptomyces sp. ODS25]
MTRTTTGAAGPPPSADPAGRTRRREEPGPWTVVLRPARGTPVGRIVAVPHSGSGPNVLAPLLHRLPADLQAVGVTLPGRERRFRESLDALSDPAAVTDAVTNELAAAEPLPTVLFGHSMGAALAAAVALAAPRLCQGLVLSAHPALDAGAGRAQEWTDEALMEVIRLSDGTPDELLGEPLLRDLVLARLRSDLTLGRRLAVRNAGQLLPVVPTVLAGRDDALVPPADLDPWTTSAPPRHRFFPGGHCYLLDEENLDAVAAEIAAALP